MYFGTREVKTVTEPDMIHPDTGETLKTGEVLIEYAEGLPQFEAMPKEEWEAGKTAEAIDKSKLAEWFVTRTTPIRVQIHKVLEQGNPRFGEITRILRWIEEAYIETFRKAVELKTGVEDFQTRGLFSDIVKIHSENGSKMIDELQPPVRDIMDVLIKHNIPVGQVLFGGYLLNAQKALETVTDRAFSLVIPPDDEHRRCNDIEDIFNTYAKPTTEAPTESAESVTNSADAPSPTSADVSAEPATGGEAGNVAEAVQGTASSDGQADHSREVEAGSPATTGEEGQPVEPATGV